MNNIIEDRNGNKLCAFCLAPIKEATSIATHDFVTWTWKFKTTYEPCPCVEQEESA